MCSFFTPRCLTPKRVPGRAPVIVKPVRSVQPFSFPTPAPSRTYLLSWFTPHQDPQSPSELPHHGPRRRHGHVKNRGLILSSLLLRPGHSSPRGCITSRFAMAAKIMAPLTFNITSLTALFLDTYRSPRLTFPKVSLIKARNQHPTSAVEETLY
ncbi:hypothetical protein BV22DRAFT_605598 [Leucogyrophana mollusca]|uniref:Uncharacterized protein n=1 Tax=Leucogyrophana mollusca TaxID=85980 RepID=A0ACB8BBT5_9AGAM|nr:hypothetical protein BV22DRAFT_605598 [Leucogyrophana mollusca]